MPRLEIKTLLQNSLLVLISVLMALALFEYGLRIHNVASPAAMLLANKFTEEPIADRHLNSISVPNGIQLGWFRQEPTRIAPEPRDVSPAAVELYEKYIRYGVYGPQSYYVWNKVFVERHVCERNDYVFGQYGDLANNLKVFMPQDGEQYPRYKNPPSMLTPSGLRTNRYGFRGPELSLHKDSRTIRIAFLGASTTIASHNFPFSYPEYFSYWLNLWLKANNYPLQVESINAGREGIDSSDIAAIFKQEVLPLAPDYAIYYEGANHMSLGSELVDTEKPQRSYPSRKLLPTKLVQSSSIAELMENVFRIRMLPILIEWRRPQSKLVFPAGITESDPDIDRGDLPINLSIILGNLHRIAVLSEKSDVRFLVSSFIWLDGGEPEIVRDRSRHIEILSQVNGVFWPLLPKDIRRLVDFQNRVFQRFAASRKLDFMDIAGAFPRDPDLFSDGIHFTPEGVRVQAWVALAQFLPHFKRDLERGFVPHTQLPTMKLDVVPVTNGESYSANCSASQV